MAGTTKLQVFTFEAVTLAALTTAVNAFLDTKPAEDIYQVYYITVSVGATRRDMAYITVKIYNQ